MSKITLKVGSPAYFETVRNGLVACKVVRIAKDEFGHVAVDVRVTAHKHKCYPAGSTIESTPRRVIPREAVYTPRGAVFPRVLPYSVEVA